MTDRILRNVMRSKEAVDLIAKIILDDPRYTRCKICTNGPFGMHDVSTLSIERKGKIICRLEIDQRVTEGRISILSDDEGLIPLPVENDKIMDIVYSRTDKTGLNA